ncbi:hypothetical protein EV175_001744 [Coemansia sp. RSA 1933]|nr:hypothetical protein EV175_001744 [Coemansia sp. RSA 1933]
MVSSDVSFTDEVLAVVESSSSNVLEQYSTDIEVAPGSPSEDAEKRSLDSMEERMANCLLDECIIRGHVKVRRSRYSSNDADDVDGGDDGDRDSDSGSSGVYEMPGDNIDELCMDLYDCGLDEPNLQQPETNNPSCIEADHLQAELSLKNQELAELNAMVESLSAEMLVQRSELEAADRKVSQLEASLQCSICLEPFSQPHSLGCDRLSLSVRVLRLSSRIRGSREKNGSPAAFIEAVRHKYAMEVAATAVAAMAIKLAF